MSFRREDKRLGPVSNTIVLIVLVCLLMLHFLGHVTKTNTYGYNIHALQREKWSLQNKHDDLSAAAASAQSVSGVKDSAEARALVATAPAGSL